MGGGWQWDSALPPPLPSRPQCGARKGSPPQGGGKTCFNVSSSRRRRRRHGAQAHFKKRLFSGRGWEDYLHWQAIAEKILERLNTPIRETSRTPFDGIGKAEPLRGDLSGWWSRRITEAHRLVYRVQEGMLQIVQCRYLY